MSDTVETLLVDVRAGTEGFAADLETMRARVDASLGGGFARAGDTLERSLSGALRKGNLGFDDLRRAATRVLDDIAANALRTLTGALGAGGGGGGSGAAPVAQGLAGLAGSLLGLPGRATGGNVAPGRGYLVGERGPEVFVPTSAGRIEAGAAAGGGREVRVAIHVVAPRGASVPQSLQRSTRQVASAVRRTLSRA